MSAAASGGMMEVKAGILAQQQGASAEIKEFGARMVADHSKANGELQALAVGKNISLPTAPPREHQKHFTEMCKMKGADFDKHYGIIGIHVLGDNCGSDVCIRNPDIFCLSAIISACCMEYPNIPPTAVAIGLDS